MGEEGDVGVDIASPRCAVVVAQADSGVEKLWNSWTVEDLGLAVAVRPFGPNCPVMIATRGIFGEPFRLKVAHGFLGLATLDVQRRPQFADGRHR